MKTIGLIGGMSWESSVQYYSLINRAVRDRLGPLHSAKILMLSHDFGEIAALQRAGEWDQLSKIMCESACALRAGGADCVVICTNTMHKLAPQMEAACDLPLIHIADPVAEAIKDKGLSTIALLGTAFTMEQDFYRGRLSETHGLDVIVPDADDRAEVHRVIYDELVSGKVLGSSRAAYRDIIARLADRGAQGVILGCTEIMLLIDQSDSAVPLFDTTALHAAAATRFAFSE
jgi:aspartate racemase